MDNVGDSSNECGGGRQQQRVFEHSAFPRLSAAPEGPEEELAREEEIEGVEGPEKELAFPKPRENCFGCGFVLWDEERVRLVTSSSGASSTPSYSPGPSTPPSYSPRSSTPQSYSPGSSRNAECSNCKHLMEKITLTQRQQWEMYRHPVQHTLIQLHYFTKFTMTWEYLDLGVVSLLECISYALSVCL
ncbi:hypothetical protein Tco_1533921 [Tanacetum coccineum]